MELKINKKKINEENYKISKKSTIDSTFKDILRSTINYKKNRMKTVSGKSLSDIENIEKLNKIGFNSLSEEDKKEVTQLIRNLEDMFNGDIVGQPDKYFKKNGTLNMVSILRDYGDNLKSNNIDSLTAQVNRLWEKGMIDDDDYFYTMRWIRTRIESDRIKMHNKDLEMKALEKLI